MGLEKAKGAILECGGSGSSDPTEEEVVVQEVLQERDEAYQKLLEIEQFSERLLSEFSKLETEFELEKTCRQQAEVYAAQMKKENKQLKRFSMHVLPMLNEAPEDILDVLWENDTPSDPVHETQQSSRSERDRWMDTSPQEQMGNRDFSKLLEDNKKLNVQVEELQSQIQHLNGQVEEDRSEKISLQSIIETYQRAFKKFNRVSQMVIQEHNDLVQKLETEQDLRQHAEVFAHKMLRKQQQVNRQSMIFLKTVESNAPLLQALEEIANMTKALEDAKQEHQAKIMVLEEAQLEGKHLQEKLEIIQAELNGTKGEKCEIENRLRQAEKRNGALEEKIKILEEKLKAAETLSTEQNNSTVVQDDPTPPPPQPPPPPPPPPVPPPPPNTLEDPLSLIKQRRGRREMKPEQGNDVSSDGKAQAVKEMMDRIKSGVVLRPARKDPQGQCMAATKRKSAINELQGILVSMKTPHRNTHCHLKASQKIKDSQLESILQRRRKISDVTLAAQSSSLSRAAVETQEQADSKQGKNLPVP
uniref:Shootin-1-like n=1 Tax=Geotrypetes seraphini TaxID=260995 RepID=A0A6P8SKE7_GEOSA|nr:shootin-1-like [Geotrypetes seraphini]